MHEQEPGKEGNKNPVHISLGLSLSSQNSKPVVIYDIFQKENDDNAKQCCFN